MKAIRTYQLLDGLLNQHTFVSRLFDSESEDLENDCIIDISCRVSPDARDALSLYPGVNDKFGNNFQLAVTCPEDCSLDIVIDELQHFINVLKTMYYG